MKDLHYVYDMLIEYSIDVNRCNFTIRCNPKDTMRQKIRDTKILLEPDVAYSLGTDGFHNSYIYGCNELPHRTFHFRIEGDVTTGAEVYESAENTDISMVFRHSHGLNQAGEKLLKYGNSLSIPTDVCDLEAAKYLMKKVYEDFSYQSGVTNVRTSAEEAWNLGHGVCQDYSHILLALLHQKGICARYATGLMVGEGVSHAWVEVLSEGKWYGLDVTNNASVGDDYILLSVGRDAQDCSINRGIMHGGGLHTQTIHACVTSKEEKNI